MAIALIWALINALVIRNISINHNNEESSLVHNDKLDTLELMGSRIAEGANTFLF